MPNVQQTTCRLVLFFLILLILICSLWAVIPGQGIVPFGVNSPDRVEGIAYKHVKTNPVFVCLDADGHQPQAPTTISVIRVLLGICKEVANSKGAALMKSWTMPYW